MGSFQRNHCCSSSFNSNDKRQRNTISCSKHSDIVNGKHKWEPMDDLQLLSQVASDYHSQKLRQQSIYVPYKWNEGWTNVFCFLSLDWRRLHLPRKKLIFKNYQWLQYMCTEKLKHYNSKVFLLSEQVLCHVIEQLKQYYFLTRVYFFINNSWYCCFGVTWSYSGWQLIWYNIIEESWQERYGKDFVTYFVMDY